jgi:hypothetical protein
MSAIISACGKYRTRLDRWIDGDVDMVRAAIFGVNPSTADATVNDATIRKDMGFARIHRWGRIIKLNKFAYRATDVTELRKAKDPIGPDNDDHIRAALKDADVVVYAWGPLAKLPKHLRHRWVDVHAIVVAAGHTPLCFGVAKDGHPRHTLMIPYSTPLQNWTHP